MLSEQTEAKELILPLFLLLWTKRQYIIYIKCFVQKYAIWDMQYHEIERMGRACITQGDFAKLRLSPVWLIIIVMTAKPVRIVMATSDPHLTYVTIGTTTLFPNGCRYEHQKDSSAIPVRASPSLHSLTFSDPFTISPHNSKSYFGLNELKKTFEQCLGLAIWNRNDGINCQKWERKSCLEEPVSTKCALSVNVFLGNESEWNRK